MKKIITNAGEKIEIFSVNAFNQQVEGTDTNDTIINLSNFLNLGTLSLLSSELLETLKNKIDVLLTDCDADSFNVILYNLKGIITNILTERSTYVSVVHSAVEKLMLSIQVKKRNIHPYYKAN